jgi:hypothetical protein
MGLKKYEIITVGSDKRVRALRSWQVGDRYVNIGDVGGIVYDEKTLSQDGLCWLFRGNFGFPGARIGGDSIVDVAEVTLSATGAPNVDILGSSVVVGSKLQFATDQTAEGAVVLTAADFERGGYASLAVGQKPGKDDGAVNFIRTKNPIFMGGKSITIKTPVPGYIITILVTDADGYIIAPYKTVITNNYQSIPTDAGQYAYIRLTKNPAGPTAPADATAAQITFTGTYEYKLSIIDSRVEINPAAGASASIIKPGSSYTMASGAKYPEAIIRNSKVSLNTPSVSGRVYRLLGQIIGSTATLDATADHVLVAGQYINVKNLQAAGILTAGVVSAYNLIQATDCDNFAVSPTIFPGLTDARTANMPFIFQGCNVPNGLFYHHAQIANTYKNIDFAKASVDLGKSFFRSTFTLVSSEVEGMYRLYSVSGFGALIESYESVMSLNMTDTARSYGTTIYKDAYFNGLFEFAGTNVFGHKVRSHPLAQVLNVQPRAVQGNFNASTAGGTITGVIQDARFCVIPVPFRVNGSNGITVQGLPGNISATGFFVNCTGVITTTTSITGSPISSDRLPEILVYIRFAKTGGAAITPADLAGVTVTVYNGCKIINTGAGAGATAVNMKGSIRVEDNATLVNAGVVGSGYFGGNSVAYYKPTVWASLDFNGTVYMKDDTVFAPSALTGASALVRMEGNAKFIGSVDVASTNLSFIMRDNAVIEGKANTRSGVVMSGNSKVTATGQIMAASRGVLIMEENASIEANTTVIGAITLSGNYKGNAVKTWTGKRTITDVNEPAYDNNVKTKYDF